MGQSQRTIDLTTPLPLPNGTKMELTRPDFFDDTAEATFTVTLRTGNATAAVICSRDMVIRDGLSTQLVRQTTPAVGLIVNDAERYFVHTADHELQKRSTPTGYTDLVNAWRAAGTGNARDTAFKTHLLSAGHIDATLTGT